jgi:hypothetical protein
MKILSRDADERFPKDVGIALHVLAFYGMLASAPMLIVGLFAGPHILAGAFGHLAVGVAALAIAVGWSRCADWARALATLLATLLAIVTAAATWLLRNGSYAGASVPSALCILSLAVVWRIHSSGART